MTLLLNVGQENKYRYPNKEAQSNKDGEWQESCVRSQRHEQQHYQTEQSGDTPKRGHSEHASKAYAERP
jgi:hypothetical protein